MPLSREAFAEGICAWVREESADFAEIDIILQEAAVGCLLEKGVVRHACPEEIGKAAGEGEGVEGLDSGFRRFWFGQKQEVRGDEDPGEHEADCTVVGIATLGGAVENREVLVDFRGVGRAAEGARKESGKESAGRIARGERI